MVENRNQQIITSFKGKYAFLSNFFSSPIICNVGHGEERYRTVEHAYQAAKSFTKEGHDAVKNAPTPGKAKAIGRKVAIRFDWESVKQDVMLIALMTKFNNPILQERLSQTGDKFLIEGNYWHDNYWGNCTCPRCEEIPGRNVLGEMLMSIRKNIPVEEDI